MTIQLGLGLADERAAAIWTRDDGTICDPATAAEWDEWVAATATRHWCDGDPLLDWLDSFGEERGFTRDDRYGTYDPRFDLMRVIAERGADFESRVLAELGRRYPLTRIASTADDVRSRDAARATWQAIAAGDPVIVRGVLRDPQARTYGIVDLIVRVDVLDEIFPGAISDEAKRTEREPDGYRTVDVRYATLELLRDGSLSTSADLGLMVRLWTLNAALGRLLGALPPVSYVLARGWRQGSLRGTSCWDHLGRVPHSAIVRSQERGLGQVATDAAAWVRRVRRQGAEWQVRPVPTVPELWPNMKARYDAPWQRAKREIAEDLHELTLISHVGPRIRAAAHARGVTRHDDPRVTASFLGLNAQNGGQIVDAILACDRGRDRQYVRPARIVEGDGKWRRPATVECYVDFETVNDALDDLATFPERGGLSLIFQIGCGRWTGEVGEDGGAREARWDFRSFTARGLRGEAEADMIDEWIGYLRGLARDAGAEWPGGVRLFHWSGAETSAIENAYRSAALRHRERHWPDLDWYDLLERVVHPEPVVVRGAHGFGLKAVAKAMHRHGLISTQWAESLADGAGAMAGAWHAHREALLRNWSLAEIPLMREIERYNEIDCRVMAEVLDHLRREH